MESVGSEWSMGSVGRGSTRCPYFPFRVFRVFRGHSYPISSRIGSPPSRR